MGVQGLWQILEPTANPVTLDSLEGKRLAVDISLWLYQAAHGFASHGGDTRAPHVVLLLNRIAKLLFYKVRPVFVFDGEGIPAFKQHVLRERQLNKALEELDVKKQLKRALKDAENGANQVDDDLFAVPDEPVNLAVKKNQYHGDGDELLSGYKELVSRDEKISFLANAKQKIKRQRLNDEDIPEDPNEFAEFQRQRLLQRFKINDEIGALRNDKIRQLANTNEKVQLTVDSHSRGHLLTRVAAENDEEDGSVKEKEERPRIANWNEFVQQVRRQYRRDDAEPEKRQNQVAVEKVGRVGGLVDEERETSVVELDDDDDVNETFNLISTEEDAVDKDYGGGLYSKSAVIESFAERFNKRKSRSMSKDSDAGSSEHDSDFEVVPLDGSDINPSSANSSKVVDVIQLDSDGSDVELMDNDDSSNIVPPIGDLVQAEARGHGVYAECQELLTYLGLPYIVAPGEAEAQCAELEMLGLVEGIVTEDSDVWLFGGRRVYKNMFSRKKNVHFFDGNVIRQKLGLSRFDFVVLTMLAGGDYTRGLEKVGIVTALELFAEFSGKGQCDSAKAFGVLESIKSWLDSKQAFMAAAGSSKQKHFVESAARIKMRKTIEKFNDDDSLEGFPNKSVFEAYIHPSVNKNKESFKWNPINFTELEPFLWQTIGWTVKDLHSKTHDAFKGWNEFVSQTLQSYQLKITGFQHKLAAFDKNELRLAPTKRVDLALKKLFKSRGIAANDRAGGAVKAPVVKNPMCMKPDYDSFSDDDNVPPSFLKNKTSEPLAEVVKGCGRSVNKKRDNIKPSELDLSEEDSSDSSGDDSDE